ncbi:MAG: Recombinase [Planctomycetota bacterium]|jgi:recombination protein RecA
MSDTASKTAPTKASDKEKTRAQDPERRKAIEAALDQIDKAYGKGSIMRLGQIEKVEIGAVPTGSLSLDLAIGIGGVPRGRIVEIYGPESSGKTTLALSIVANAQKEGGVAAFIDAEHALDPTWAEKIGVKLDDLLVSQPSFGEQALDICDLLVRSNGVDVVVVDSVAALTPKAELEGEMDESQVGVQARMMSKAMRKLTGAISQSKTTVIFINQIREKIGVTYGSPETQPGGRALKFAASLRLDIRRVTSITEGEQATGNRVRVKVVKNKVSRPFTRAEFDIMFNEGISFTGDVIDLGVAAKTVTKSGSWYTYGATKLGQGRENAKQFLKDNPKVCEEIVAKIRAAGPGSAPRGRGVPRPGPHRPAVRPAAHRHPRGMGVPPMRVARADPTIHAPTWTIPDNPILRMHHRILGRCTAMVPDPMARASSPAPWVHAGLITAESRHGGTALPASAA